MSTLQAGIVIDGNSEGSRIVFSHNAKVVFGSHTFEAEELGALLKILMKQYPEVKI